MTQNYQIWEEEITSILVENLECTRSDAQAIMEAQPFTMAQSWGKGLGPVQTAAIIEAESMSSI